MRQLILPLMAAGIVCACQATQTTQGQASPPADYREQVAARVKKAFFDPYSVRDAAISRPFLQSTAFDGVTPIPHSGWMVCVRANAKNRMGAYTGLSETGYMFNGGRIVDADFKGHFCADAAASYEPFPEIDSAAAPASGPNPKRR